MVLEIPTYPSFRVYPLTDIDGNTAQLFVPVDIRYEYCAMKIGDNVNIFYITVPDAVQEVIQTFIDNICSGIK